MKKLALLLVLSAGFIFCQSAAPTRTVSIDPSGACEDRVENQFNERNGKLWGCVDTTGQGFGTWTQISGSGGGVADPGANGPMKRTALNVTAPSTSTDIIGLFSACSGTQYLGADGSCHNNGGGGVVLDVTAGVGISVAGSSAHPIVGADLTVIPSLGGNDVFGGLNNMSQQIITKSTTYTTTTADWGTICDTATAGGPLTMSLVASPTTGLVQWFKNLGTSLCTISGNGKNIDGAATSTLLATTNNAMGVQYDGAQWRILWQPSSGGSGPSITQGTYASLPGTCTTNDVYYFTNSYYVARCSATNTWSYFVDGHKIVLPGAASGWTLVSNSGSAAKADSKGAVVLSSSSNVTGAEVLLRATPATPYVQTELLTVVADGGLVGGTTLDINCGVFWSDGTATTNTLVGGLFDVTNSPANWRIFTSTINSTGISNLSGPNGNALSGNKVWVQISDNGTTKAMLFSGDGVNFFPAYSASHASTITPTNYGIGCYGWNGTGHAWQVSLLGEVVGAI